MIWYDITAIVSKASQKILSYIIYTSWQMHGHEIFSVMHLIHTHKMKGNIQTYILLCCPNGCY
jgi:hypothetical protein